MLFPLHREERKIIMMDFKAVANKAFDYSPVMVGKRIATSEILHTRLEIQAVDIITMNGKDVSVWNFKGMPGHYFGGMKLTQVATAWRTEYARQHNGEFDLNDFNSELSKANITFVMEMKRTRKGNNFVNIEFVD